MNIKLKTSRDNFKMRIKLKTLREECGGCPTAYSGQTFDGKEFYVRLRHGAMKLELDDKVLVSFNAKGLDGVCGFYDFKDQFKRQGYIIDDSEAEYSSQVQETAAKIDKMFRDKVWVKFTKALSTKEKTYNEGEKFCTNKTLAQSLVDLGYAEICD